MKASLFLSVPYLLLVCTSAQVLPSRSAQASQPTAPINDHISLQVSSIIDEALTQAGKRRMEAAVQKVEKDLQIRILARETNPQSIKFLEMGYPSKPMSLKAKTAAVGLIAGLIPMDQQLSKATEQELKKFTDQLQKGIKEGRIKAIPAERDGYVIVLNSTKEQVWRGKNQLRPTDRVIEVVADAQTALPIVSDLDLALVSLGPTTAQRASETKVLQSPNTGIESEFEGTVREKINEAYLEQAHREAFTKKKPTNRLVNHGPEVRNPNARPPDYPFVDSEGNQIAEGPKEDPHLYLRRYLGKLKEQNQDFEIPEHWKKAIENI